ncbi:hypothetical protein C8J56DRAFT_1169698 [Mycena floridula]|nr:hypothetical protein C8J56DRAFT_1169698 [Mycena floridula]
MNDMLTSWTLNILRGSDFNVSEQGAEWQHPVMITLLSSSTTELMVVSNTNMIDLATKTNREQAVDLTPPIETLPNEVLGLIFVESCELYEQALDAKSFPWIAGKVCRRWREIALSFSPLWNQLDLRLSTNAAGVTTTGLYGRGHQLRSSSAEILQECLRRSKNSSLKIQISYVARDREKSSAVSDLLLLVGAHSERWKSAVVWVQVSSFAWSLFRQVHNHLPRLEMLHWQGLPHPLAKTIVAPSLWKMNLTELSCTRSFPQWSQLKQITLDTSYGLAPPSDQLSSIIHDLRTLQASHQLVRLELNSSSTLDSHLQHAEFQFNHLRVLRCRPSMSKVFLKLPALEELDLSPGLTSGLASFPAFLHRTAPKLTSLTLPTLIGDESFSRSAIDGLNMLPSLTILRMRQPYLDSCASHTLFGRIQSVFWQQGKNSHAIIDYLRVDPDHLDQAPVPNLQHLSLWGNFIPGFLDMVESRFSTEARTSKTTSGSCSHTLFNGVGRLDLAQLARIALRNWALDRIVSFEVQRLELSEAETDRAKTLAKASAAVPMRSDLPFAQTTIFIGASSEAAITRAFYQPQLLLFPAQRLRRDTSSLALEPSVGRLVRTSMALGLHLV